MTRLLILNEKQSQAEKFADYLGGMSGVFEGNPYDIVYAAGHLLQLKSPSEMVSPELAAKYADWQNLDNFPWNPLDLSWSKSVISSKKRYITNIENNLAGHDVIVIASDNDPTGEGDLLGWEIVDYLDWKKEVWRIRFKGDDSANYVIDSLRSPEKANANEQDSQGILVKGKSRQKFDFLTGLEESRIATKLAREQGFSNKGKALSIGRLQTYITCLVDAQNRARKAYVKKPFYEIRYKDANGNTFKREYQDSDTWRFSDKNLASQDLTNYSQDQVIVDSTVEKRKQPPKLVNLADLGKIFQKEYTTDQVTDTYQKMYDDKIVSYPRTEDNAITIDDFNELLPYAEKIATVVGVDSQLLSHKEPRKKFIIKSEDHGANRPTKLVPQSLDDVEKKYGKCGRDIYERVAKSYLAMLAEDCVYTQVKAHIESHPEFTSTINVPKEQNYKLIFNEDDLDENQRSESKVKDFATNANPEVYQGTNTPPTKPTLTFILNNLDKWNLGTGATKMQTISKLQGIGKENKNVIPQLKVVKGVFEVTGTGALVACLAKDTYLSSGKITKRLQDILNEIKADPTKQDMVYSVATKTIEHDKAVMIKNAPLLKQDAQVKKLAGDLKAIERFSGIFSQTNETVNPPATIFDGHKTTETEQQEALAGKKITYSIEKFGKEEQHTAYLAKQTYKNNKTGKAVTRVSWKVEFPEDTDHVKGIYKPLDKEIKFKKEYAQHVFSEGEITNLLAGEEISFEGIDKRGKSFTATGKLVEQELKEGRRKIRFWGFRINPKPVDTNVYVVITYKDGKEYHFKKIYRGHRWTPEEIKKIAAGKKQIVAFNGRKGTYRMEIKPNPNKDYKGKFKYFGFDEKFVK
ncbi:MAG: DNA topoisomerase [Lactobacillus crispatus]|nr:DNA topoisomerase [Lactobacillus crispatus]MCT7745436.1 DNA topoisomerase [Lactobacillus crispatus]